MIVARLRVAGGRPVEERLVNVGLHDRELDAGVVAQMLDVRGRTRRGQDLQLDIGIGRDELGEIDADREIGALFVGRHDLVLGRSDGGPAV